MTAELNVFVALRILPGFFTSCLFLGLRDALALLARSTRALFARHVPASCCPSSPDACRRVLTRAGMRAVWRSFLLDARREAQRAGDPAPNPRVALLADARSSSPAAAAAAAEIPCRLQELSREGRPLVINMGSAS
ncbi:unnamed protein product [Lampetra planeri]